MSQFSKGAFLRCCNEALSNCISMYNKRLLSVLSSFIRS